MIIEVSDDDEDEEDDSDEDVTKGGDARNASAMQPRPFRNMGPLSNFPQRANFSGQSSVSAPGTPNVDYQRKTKEIEDLKRKIAEKEARAKTNGQTNGNIAPSSADDQLRSSNTNTPTAEQAHVKGQSFPVDTEDGTIRQQDLPSERRLSAAALWRRQEKEKLQQRLQELQQAMPKALKRGLDSTAGQEADVQMGSDNVEDGEVVDPVEDHQAIEENAEEGEVDEEPNAYLQIANRDDKMDSQATTVRGSQSEFNGVAPAPTTVGEAVPSQQDDEVAIAGNCLVVGEANQLASNASHADEEFEGDLGSEGEEDFYGEQAQHEGPTSDTNVRVHSTAPENDAKDEDEDEARDKNEDEDGGDEDEDDENDLDNPNMPADHPMLGNAPTSPDINVTDEDEAKVEAELDGEVGNVEIEDGDGTSSASEYEPEPIQATTTANDDLAPELQPPDEEQTAVSDQGSQPPKYYTPYQSPLTRFKDYRYHPEFLNNVPGGFKSLTFSHKIDPTQPLCPFEAAGGKCNDKNCQYQHFSSMGLSDNELLKVLGTPSIPNPDDDRRWKEGLGAVVKQLRGTNLGRDAAAIAARIAEFRREFVGDPTKTINLG